MLPSIFFGISLAIALNVQMMSSPLAGAWALFMAAGCVVMLHKSHDSDRGIVWWACLAWLCILELSTFVFAPIANGAAVMWILAAMPCVALSMRKEYLKSHLIAASIVLTTYAVGLIVQMLLGVHYTNINYFSDWRGLPIVSWPLLDPNNAAAVINMGLIPCFYMALRKPKWWALVGIFVFSLVATASKTGSIVAFFAITAILTERFFLNIDCVLIFILAIIYAAMEWAGYWIIHGAFQYRFLIWADSLPLLLKNPLSGLGLGSFAEYYNQVRTEHQTAGFFAHNDMLQIGIESGIPAALAFLGVFIAVCFTTTHRNIVSAAVIMAIFAHSMMEFQFYLPSITLLMGLALAYHRCNDKRVAIYSTK